MARTKTAFFCKNCGYESPKWQGKCPSCGEWNQFAEEPIPTKSVDSKRAVAYPSEPEVPVIITEIVAEHQARLTLSDPELNRVLGGGLVPGSVVLVAGEPGIGKSTLLLQMALEYTRGKVLYVSGEESGEQIAQRARRIREHSSQCYLLTNTNPEVVGNQARELQAEVIVIDSVQTLSTPWIESSQGSLPQIRESAAQMIRLAKSTGTAIFLIGHITKDGSIAGPKILEHMVDVVLLFEGDGQHLFRLLRCTKNRYGDTQELGIYLMESKGLRPVDNPSEHLLPAQYSNLSGTANAAIVEGIRPIIIEVQALVSSAVYGTPQRSSTGFDLRRLHMLLAVLEKRCGFRLGSSDVFLNLAGGIRVNDPSIDLAVVAAILSSARDVAVPSGHCFAAEVGLNGEVRPVVRADQRIAEAARLGMKCIWISESQREAGKSGTPIKVNTIAQVQQLPELLLMER